MRVRRTGGAAGAVAAGRCLKGRARDHGANARDGRHNGEILTKKGGKRETADARIFPKNLHCPACRRKVWTGLVSQGWLLVGRVTAPGTVETLEPG